MKVTELKYPVRSRFIEPCNRVIQSSKDDWLAGRTIEIQLPPQSYNRRAIATINRNDPHFFWIDKKSDPTRFSSRIHAAAKVTESKEYGASYSSMFLTSLNLSADR